MRKAALRDLLLYATTTMFMLRVGKRALYNYVAQDKLICEKFILIIYILHAI